MEESEGGENLRFPYSRNRVAAVRTVPPIDPVLDDLEVYPLDQERSALRAECRVELVAGHISE